MSQNNQDFSNKYDNSDLQVREGAKEIATTFNSNAEMMEYQQYLKTMILESDALRDGRKTLIVDPITGKKKAVPLSTVVSVKSEFDNTRKMVIIRLNALASGNPEQKSELRRLMSNIGTDSIWELSTKISNVIVGKIREDRIIKDFYKHDKSEVEDRWNLNAALEIADEVATQMPSLPPSEVVTDVEQ